MSCVPALSSTEVDALREMANIGSGHAATVLSQMTGVSVMIDVPRVSVAPLGAVASRFAAPDERVVALTMEMLGDLRGHTSFLMREPNAGVLADLLLQRPVGSGTTFGPLEQSSLKELGNIMAGSFLNALAQCMGNYLLPSVPIFQVDRSAAFATPAFGGSESALVVATDFRFDEPVLADHELHGMFLYALDEASIAALLGAMQVA
ncbi:MAG TPA: chemotaxis protein CheC [Gemmatimonadales bacterium]